jgi:signal transduction histidine kinase
VGFDAPSVLSCKNRSGLGLVGIRERLNAIGGTLQIDSVVGRGTELLFKIPVEK